MALEKWDERFLSVATLAAEWSKDPNAKVGAVVVDTQGQVASVGYNGFPKLVEDSIERLKDGPTKLELIVHAEVNAILGAGVRARGGTMFVFGKPVCARCAGSIIQAGIARVVAAKPQFGTESKWDKSGQLYSVHVRTRKGRIFETPVKSGSTRQAIFGFSRGRSIACDMMVEAKVVFVSTSN